ncbi:hypothetical protein ACFYRC_15655 [Streptomyces sp. NPDC005279]|uniref:hypothetical protein n=1 Tax=Streptomyces sp. NPDC005279 TaxID=3364712 RepID=UPI00368E66A0
MGTLLWTAPAGIDPVEVARRAAHNIAVPFRLYAKILRGEHPDPISSSRKS